MELFPFSVVRRGSSLTPQKSVWTWSLCHSWSSTTSRVPWIVSCCLALPGQYTKFVQKVQFVVQRVALNLSTKTPLRSYRRRVLMRRTEWDPRRTMQRWDSVAVASSPTGSWVAPVAGAARGRRSSAVLEERAAASAEYRLGPLSKRQSRSGLRASAFPRATTQNNTARSLLREVLSTDKRQLTIPYDWFKQILKVLPTQLESW